MIFGNFGEHFIIGLALNSVDVLVQTILLLPLVGFQLVLDLL